MTEPTKLDQVLGTLEQRRDEIKLKIHLGGAELKDEWNRLDGEVDAFKEQVRIKATDAGVAADAALEPDFELLGRLLPRKALEFRPVLVTIEKPVHDVRSLGVGPSMENELSWEFRHSPGKGRVPRHGMAAEPVWHDAIGDMRSRAFRERGDQAVKAIGHARMNIVYLGEKPRVVAHVATCLGCRLSAFLSGSKALRRRRSP